MAAYTLAQRLRWTWLWAVDVGSPPYPSSLRSDVQGLNHLELVALIQLSSFLPLMHTGCEYSMVRSRHERQGIHSSRPAVLAM